MVFEMMSSMLSGMLCCRWHSYCKTPAISFAVNAWSWLVHWGHLTTVWLLTLFNQNPALRHSPFSALSVVTVMAGFAHRHSNQWFVFQTVRLWINSTVFLRNIHGNIFMIDCAHYFFAVFFATFCVMELSS